MQLWTITVTNTLKLGINTVPLEIIPPTSYFISYQQYKYSSISIVMGYGKDGWGLGVWFLTGARYFLYCLRPNRSPIQQKKSKFVKSEHARYTFERYEKGRSITFLLNIKLFKSKKFFIRLNITTITTSNARAFKEFLCPLYLLTLLLVGICTLSVHQKEWLNVGVHVIH
jgi:hypothetical protein